MRFESVTSSITSGLRVARSYYDDAHDTVMMIIMRSLDKTLQCMTVATNSIAFFYIKPTAGWLLAIRQAALMIIISIIV